ncbi:MAG: hypothetical protein RBR32_02590 [Bacteroidales bacterium]|nr:hypothetical protein [Bacteroidales bacterium]
MKTLFDNNIIADIKNRDLLINSEPDIVFSYKLYFLEVLKCRVFCLTNAL